MSRGIDKLIDLMREPQWSMPTATRTLVKIDAAPEMAIVPETPNGPVLEMTTQDGEGNVILKQRWNLPAVDDLIGKLIKMRDHMAQMKGE
jgi:hypothetical protein